jgi:hypothetical protein
MGHEMSSETTMQFAAHENLLQDFLVVVLIVSKCCHLTVVFENVKFVNCVEKKSLTGEIERAKLYRKLRV